MRTWPQTCYLLSRNTFVLWFSCVLFINAKSLFSNDEMNLRYWMNHFGIFIWVDKRFNIYVTAIIILVLTNRVSNGKRDNKGFQFKKARRPTEQTVLNDEEQCRYNFGHAAFTNVIFNWFSFGNLFFLPTYKCWLTYFFMKQQCWHLLFLFTLFKLYFIF